MLNITTVPIYQFVILQAFSELVTTENLTQAVNCNGVAFANKHKWIYAELLGFWVNLLLLMLYLFMQLDILEGTQRILACCFKDCKKDDQKDEQK